MLQWPFDNVQNSSYGAEIQVGFVENTSQQGIQERIETFSDVDDIIEGFIILDEITEFNDFFTIDTVNGTIPFEFYDGVSEVTRTASFIGKPNVSKVSNKYRVSFTWRVEHLPIDNAPPVLSTNRITEDIIDRVTEDNIQRVTE